MLETDIIFLFLRQTKNNVIYLFTSQTSKEEIKSTVFVLVQSRSTLYSSKIDFTDWQVHWLSREYDWALVN